MTDITTTEQFNHVAEEIAEEVKQARADTAFKRNVDLVEGYWNVGRAFISNPQYKKFAKQQGQLFATVAKMTGIGERNLRYCVQFCEHYPGEMFEADVLPELPGGKSPIWRDIVRELPSGRREKKVEEPKCKHCPIHCNG